MLELLRVKLRIVLRQEKHIFAASVLLTLVISLPWLFIKLTSLSKLLQAAFVLALCGFSLCMLITSLVSPSQLGRLLRFSGFGPASEILPREDIDSLVIHGADIGKVLHTNSIVLVLTSIILELPLVVPALLFSGTDTCSLLGVAALPALLPVVAVVSTLRVLEVQLRRDLLRHVLVALTVAIAGYVCVYTAYLLDLIAETYLMTCGLIMLALIVASVAAVKHSLSVLTKSTTRAVVIEPVLCSQVPTTVSTSTAIELVGLEVREIADLMLNLVLSRKIIAGLALTAVLVLVPVYVLPSVLPADTKSENMLVAIQLGTTYPTLGLLLLLAYTIQCSGLRLSPVLYTARLHHTDFTRLLGLLVRRAYIRLMPSVLATILTTAVLLPLVRDLTLMHFLLSFCLSVLVLQLLVPLAILYSASKMYEYLLEKSRMSLVVVGGNPIFEWQHVVTRRVSFKVMLIYLLAVLLVLLPIDIVFASVISLDIPVSIAGLLLLAVMPPCVTILVVLSYILYRKAVEKLVQV